MPTNDNALRVFFVALICLTFDLQSNENVSFVPNKLFFKNPIFFYLVKAISKDRREKMKAKKIIKIKTKQIGNNQSNQDKTTNKTLLGFGCVCFCVQIVAVQIVAAKQTKRTLLHAS